jgi:hypothetical protein
MQKATCDQRWPRCPWVVHRFGEPREGCHEDFRAQVALRFRPLNIVDERDLRDAARKPGEYVKEQAQQIAPAVPQPAAKAKVQ